MNLEAIFQDILLQYLKHFHWNQIHCIICLHLHESGRVSVVLETLFDGNDLKVCLVEFEMIRNQNHFLGFLGQQSRKRLQEITIICSGQFLSSHLAKIDYRI